MMTIKDELEKRAREYAARNNRDLDLFKELGFGQDGRIWRTHQHTAVKIFERQSNYTRERSCYQRLKVKGVTAIDGLNVPRLIDFDDTLLVVEMGIVKAPWLLDFGKAHLDIPPPFGPDQMDDWEELLEGQFGEDAGRVRQVLWKLRQLGIYYLDINPGNIRLYPDESPSGDSSGISS